MTAWMRAFGWGSIRAVACGALLCGLVLPAALSGQSSELTRVDRLLEEGRFGEARTALEGWLEEGLNDGSRQDRQHGLWLRAVLTIDPGMAELDLRRLVVEYPGGSYSDEALLRLAHAARLRDDDYAATQYLEILTRDYPESPHRVEARSLLSRLQDPSETAAAERARVPPTASRDGGNAGATAPRPRAGVPGAAPGPDADAAREPAAVEPEMSRPFTIQLGAFSTAARALTHALEVRDAGFDGELEPRVVTLEGSDLARVRIGGFETREAAQDLVLEIREMGFEAVVSADRDREEPVR